MSTTPESRIKTIRTEAGMSLDAVAALTGCDKGYLSRIERYKKRPSVDLIARLCEVLPGLEPNDFFPEIKTLHRDNAIPEAAE